MKAVILCLTLSLGSSACADSWMPPSTEQYFSDNGEYGVTVVPREFKRRVEGGTKADSHSADAADNALTSVPPYATLTHLVPERDPITIWTTTLVNDVAPVRALVSADGKYVVTFDNWGRMGKGDDAIVIYGANGEVIKQFSLVEIVGKRRFKRFSRSMSSINWGGKHSFSDDGESVVLHIVDSKSRYSSHKGKAQTYFAKRIRLRDGKVVDDLIQGITYGLVLGAVVIVLFLVLRRQQDDVIEDH